MNHQYLTCPTDAKISPLQIWCHFSRCHRKSFSSRVPTSLHRAIYIQNRKHCPGKNPSCLKRKGPLSVDQIGADGHTILDNTTIVHAPVETMMYVAHDLHLCCHGSLSLSDIQARNNQLAEYTISTSNISPSFCGKINQHTRTTFMLCTLEINFHNMSIGFCILDCAVSMSLLRSIFLVVRPSTPTTWMVLSIRSIRVVPISVFGLCLAEFNPTLTKQHGQSKARRCHLSTQLPFVFFHRHWKQSSWLFCLPEFVLQPCISHLYFPTVLVIKLFKETEHWSWFQTVQVSIWICQHRSFSQHSSTETHRLEKLPPPGLQHLLCLFLSSTDLWKRVLYIHHHDNMYHLWCCIW